MLNSVKLYNKIDSGSSVDVLKKNLHYKIYDKVDMNTENVSLILTTLMRELYTEVEHTILDNIK
jgi:hypothetical protein